jgi:type I restriction enzyme S subunit
MVVKSNVTYTLEDWRDVTVDDLKAHTDNALATGPFGSSIGSIFFQDRGIPVIRGGNLSGDSEIRLKDDGLVFLTKEKATEFKRSIVRKGDLIFTCWGSIDQVGLIDDHAQFNEYIISNKQMKFTPDIQKSDSLFLYYLFSSSEIQKKIFDQSIGSSIPGFNLGLLRSIKFKIPQLLEQHTIAIVLSDTDAQISSLNQVIAKKRDMKQAAMQELLTGKRRLPGFKGEWIPQRLKKYVRDFIVPMRDKPKFFSGIIPWCRIEDFDGKYLFGSKSGQYVEDITIKEMNLKVFPSGTLLVSCSADLGRCAIVGKPLVTNQTFIGLIVDESSVSNEFLYYYMTFKAEDLNNLSSGTTISYLSREQFEVFLVRIPPTKEEQSAIATVLSDMDSELAALEQKRDKTKAIKQGMMQELLTGRIRLT